MAIFRINKNDVTQVPLKEDGFGNEAELRDLFADSLEDILGVRFLAKEYPTTNGRIDTLGLDENNSPVIIEYKWKQNEEVLAQGLFYFDWLMSNKPHFDLLVKNKLGQEVEVNWDQPRVVLVAQGFSRYVLAAVQRVKNVELKTYHYYTPDILQVENVYTPTGVNAVVRSTREQTEEEVVKEVKDMSFQDHMNITSPAMQEKFNELREMIFELPSVIEKDNQRSGITYRTTKSFARFEFRPTWIQLLLRDPKYDADTKGAIRDITSNDWGYHGMVKFTPESDAEYIFSLVKASYDSTL